MIGQTISHYKIIENGGPSYPLDQTDQDRSEGGPA